MNGQEFTNELNRLLGPFEKALLDCLEACSRKDMMVVRNSMDSIVRLFEPIKYLHGEYTDDFGS